MFDGLTKWLRRPGPDRGTYKNAKEAFLTQVGYSVGLGNFWRFPYLCYLHGGVTFLIAYGVSVVCVGFPLYLLELTLGQYVGRGPTHVFAFMCPILSGIGWGMLLMLLMISVYYNFILSWSIFYTGASFFWPLPWSHCRRDSETEGEWWKLGGCPRSSVNLSYESAKDYFEHEILGNPTEGENPYELKLRLVLCLGVAWLVVCVFLAKGIKQTGKLLYVTVIYPYMVLLCLFGINYDHISAETKDQWAKDLTNINFAKLLTPETWSAAVSQVIYSLGIVQGGLPMIASRNRLTHNVVRDAFMLCFLDVATSVFCVNVLFSLTASLPPQMIHDNNGISPLVFTLFSAMLSRFGSSIWAFLFFFMIFCLGFDSLLLMVEAITTTLFDQFPALRPFHLLVVVSFCGALFLLGLPMCTGSGITIFELMNNYTTKHSMFFIAFLEVVIAGYFFGHKRILKLMEEDLELWIPAPLRWYLSATWFVITPVILLLFCGISLYTENWAALKEGTPTFLSGQAIAFAPLLLVPVFALRAYSTRGNRTLRELFNATLDFSTTEFHRGEEDPETDSGGAQPSNYAYFRDYENYI